MFARLIERFIKEEDGQGISEYGSIIAFVSVLVFFVFTFSNGTLSQSLQRCSSSMIGQLNRINNAVVSFTGT